MGECRYRSEPSILVTGGTVSGEVTYELYPLNVFVLVRGIINEKQWLVPYVGGGWTRMYYRVKVQDQDTVRYVVDQLNRRRPAAWSSLSRQSAR